MTKLKIRIISICAVVGVGLFLAIQHYVRIKSSGENQSLREQLSQQAGLSAQSRSDSEKATNQLAMLEQENERLRKQTMEIYKLRGNAGRLRQSERELAQLKASSDSNDPTQAERKLSLARVGELKQRLERMPDKKIPELQFIDESKWAEDARKGKLDTEDGVRQTMGNLRRAAKLNFAHPLAKALDSYKASNEQLPNGILDLKPYFNPPVDDVILQRYELLHAGKFSDFQNDELLVGERAPVDDQYDTLFRIGTSGYTMHGVGNWSKMGFTNSWR